MRFRTSMALLAGALSLASCAADLHEGSAMARDPNVPGATGQAVVIGSSSSMAGSGRVHPDWSSASLNSY
ncbi:MAG TPA: hypothetical protein VFG12_03845 [Rhodopila sp.]|jgi:hypothetical protein|nr:hypothetical protein [Rhodopila sp.]